MILGQRVGLRALARSDMQLFHSWRNNLAMYPLSLPIVPMTMEQVEREYQQLGQHPGNWTMVVQTTDDDSAVGLLEVRELSNRLQTARLSVAIVPAQRRVGYGREAVMLGLGQLFSQANLVTVSAHIREQDEAGLALADSCGFTRNGVFRRNLFRDGQHRNTVLMSITVDEYPLNDYLAGWKDRV